MLKPLKALLKGNGNNPEFSLEDLVLTIPLVALNLIFSKGWTKKKKKTSVWFKGLNLMVCWIQGWIKGL